MWHRIDEVELSIQHGEEKARLEAEIEALRAANKVMRKALETVLPEFMDPESNDVTELGATIVKALATTAEEMGI
jgi:hypothetical protein